MHVRIIRGRFDPGREEEVQHLTESAVIPALQGLPGFKSYQGGLDRSAGRLVAITNWDTEEHARFSRDKIADTVSQLQATGVQLELPEVYEVTAEG